jgi:hypothetical protein
MTDRAEPPAGTGFTWRLVEPEDPRPPQVVLGVMLLAAAALGLFIFVGIQARWPDWNSQNLAIEHRPKAAPWLIPLVVVSLSIGLLVRAGLRRAYPGLGRRIPPLFARLALLAAGGITGIANLRLLIWTIAQGDAEAVLMGGTSLVLSAGIILQVRILLRLPEIRRTRDDLDGGLV